MARGTQLQILGPLEARGPEGPVGLGGPRQRAVLAVLAIHLGEAVSMDRLADQVWAGEPPPTATRTLQAYLSHLRRALAPTGLDIERKGAGYALAGDPELVDARLLESLHDEARRALDAGDPGRARPLLTTALALGAGEPLLDFAYEPFAQPEILRLQELRLSALEHRIEADLRLGRHGELVAELEALVHAHPLREGLTARLMRALHAAGRRSEALRAYQDLRHRLAEETGLAPGEELRALEQALLLEEGPAAPGRAAPTGGNLPVDLTTLVGRDGDLAELELELRRTRLLTLTGPGGAGKTRLAVELGRRCGAGYPDGAWMVELAALRAPDQLTATMAAVLGLRFETGDGADALAELINARALLVVLDNCEHLVAAVAALADHLLRACPNLRVVATSRSPLHVPGEVCWRVPSLSVPPADAGRHELATYAAVRLFVERASRHAPGFAIDDATGPHVGAVCRRLDGIPLALELAAARLATLGAADLAARIERDTSGLSAAGLLADDRHRTLEATIGWSERLLTPTEALMFRRLAVFAGPFDVAMAEAVGGDVDVLEGLVAGSLVERVDRHGPRALFRLLQPIRDHAAARLVEDGAEHDRARDRHAAVMADVARRECPRLRGPEAPAALTRLDAHRHDLRVALDWLIEQADADAALAMAAAVWTYWDYRYAVTEGRSCLGRAMALDGGDLEDRLEAMAGAARLAWLDGDLVEARRLAEQGVAEAASGPFEAVAAELLLQLAELERDGSGDLTRASQLAEAALASFDRLEMRWWAAETCRLLALLARDGGDEVRASAMAERCLTIGQSEGDRERTAGAHLLLGLLAEDRGDEDEARPHLEASVELFRAAGERWGTAQALLVLAAALVASGDGARGEPLAREALAESERLGSRRAAAEAKRVLADAALIRGDLDAADALASGALRTQRASSPTSHVVATLHSLARVAEARGDRARAVTLADEALVPYRQDGLARNAGPPLLLLARLRAAEGRVREAIDLCEEAMALAETVGDRRGLAAAADVLGTVEVDLRHVTTRAYDPPAPPR